MVRIVRVAALVATLNGVSCFFEHEDGSSSSPLSHMHFNIDGADVNIDCTKLDSTQDPVGDSLDTVGGTSASTSETFLAWVPANAAALRAPTVVGDYPVVSWNENGPSTPPLPAPFSLTLNLYGVPAAQPDVNQQWFSCGAGQCGLPTPDPTHFQRITSITEQASGTPGMATFRISATFVAEVWKVTDRSTTTTATGDWSLLVTVPDPGTKLDGGAPDDGGT
jgi:hypothetical protein